MHTHKHTFLCVCVCFLFLGDPFGLNFSNISGLGKSPFPFRALGALLEGVCVFVCVCLCVCVCMFVLCTNVCDCVYIFVIVCVCTTGNASFTTLFVRNVDAVKPLVLEAVGGMFKSLPGLTMLDLSGI